MSRTGNYNHPSFDEADNSKRSKEQLSDDILGFILFSKILQDKLLIYVHAKTAFHHAFKEFISLSYDVEEKDIEAYMKDFEEKSKIAYSRIF